MNDTNYDESIAYRVVKNHEEQYSIWPLARALPLGWFDGLFEGNKQACLAHIETVWTDMRPLSLRKQMELSSDRAVVQEESALVDAGPTLVQRLSTDLHDVRVVLRPENSKLALKESVERGFVQIEFINTKGGTTLGFSLDDSASDIKKLDSNEDDYEIVLSGVLTLNFQKVRCIANINVKTFAGKGKLELA